MFRLLEKKKTSRLRVTFLGWINHLWMERNGQRQDSVILLAGWITSRSLCAQVVSTLVRMQTSCAVNPPWCLLHPAQEKQEFVLFPFQYPPTAGPGANSLRVLGQRPNPNVPIGGSLYLTTCSSSQTQSLGLFRPSRPRSNCFLMRH